MKKDRQKKKAGLAHVPLLYPTSAPTKTHRSGYDHCNGNNDDKTRPERAVGGLWDLAMTTGRTKPTRLCHAQVHVDTLELAQ